MERRAKKFQKNMTTALNAIAVATAGIGVAMAGATKMSANFEEAMADVEKVTDASTMKEMKEEIEDMANAIPMAHQELAQLARDAARMGIQGAEALSTFTETVSRMSFATTLSADRAGKALGRLTKWLNIPAKYAENLGAAINELSNRLPADADEIVRSLGKTGQQFEILGASTQTTLALTASISGLADSAERGGTRMRRLIQQLQEPSTIRDVAEAIGMTADELKGLIEESPRDAIMLLAETMAEGGSKADQMREVLATTSRSTLTLLANNLDIVNDALAMTGEQLENPTSLIKEFQIAVNTTNAQLKLLWQNIKNVIMNALGNQANKAVKEAIKWMREWVLTIENLIDDNEELQKAIQTVLKTALKIGGIITVARLAAGALLALLNPVTALTMAFFALGAAWRYNAWGIRNFAESKAVEFFQNLWEAIKGIADGLSDIPDKPFEGLDKIFETGKDHPIATGTIALGISKLVFGVGAGAALKNLVIGSGVSGGLKTLSGFSIVGTVLKYSVPTVIIGLSISDVVVDTVTGDLGLVEGIAKALTGAVVGGLAFFAASALGAPTMGAAIVGFVGARIGIKFVDFFSEDIADVEEIAEYIDMPVEELRKIAETPKGKLSTIADLVKKTFDAEQIKDFRGERKELQRMAEAGTMSKRDEEYLEILNRILEVWEKINEERKKGGGPVSGGGGDKSIERQHGGFVPGTGSGDIIPAMLEPGEFVWPREMVSKFPGIIKGMWQGFKKGGPVSTGKHYYGPGEDKKTAPDFLYRWLENPPFPIVDPDEATKVNEAMQKWRREFGAVITLFEEFSGIGRNTNARFEALQNELEAFEDDLGGVTEDLDILSLSLSELSDTIDKMGVRDIGKIGDIWKTLTTRRTDWSRQGYLPEELVSPGGVQRGVSRTKRDPSIEMLATVADFEGGLQGIVDKIVELEDVAKKYGIQSEFLTGDIERLRTNLKEAGFDIEEFDKMLAEARDTGDETTDKLKELANAMGLTKKELSQFRNAISTVTSGLMEVAQATGKMSAGTSARLGGITSAAQSALSGNWLQAAMDLFTGFMTGWIEDLKEQKKELQEKVDATFSIVLEGLQGFTQEITSLTNQLAGPFGSAISGALDGFTGFYRMTQQFVQDDIIGMVKTGFSALMSIVTGITSSFISLLQRSSQWEALQSELNPIWDALAEAFGTLLTPVVALARWLREYLGISKDVGEDMEEIADLNVPSGFKRARKVWEAARPGQPVSTAGGGGVGMTIPDWAKQIIKPIKDKLVPYLEGSKDFLQGIKNWAKGIWDWLAQLIVKWIPQFFKFLGVVAKWVANIPWKTIFGYITMAAQWFLKNFPAAWNMFVKKIDSLLKGTLGENGFLATIQSIDDTLKAIAQSMGVAAGALGGAGVGAAIGGLIGGGPGALIGGAIGAGVGALAGWLGFAEGGVVTGPTPGIVGEAGPEAVIPLDRLGDFGPSNIEININTSGDGVADQIIDDIQVKNKRLTGSRSTSAALNRRTYA